MSGCMGGIGNGMADVVRIVDIGVGWIGRMGLSGVGRVGAEAVEAGIDAVVGVVATGVEGVVAGGGVVEAGKVVDEAGVVGGGVECGTELVVAAVSTAFSAVRVANSRSCLISAFM